jgi:glycosyltransferase involved in cell wall biosynthesis
MRVLGVTNALPSADAPSAGIFIEQQLASVRDHGVELDVIALDRVGGGRGVYRTLRRRVEDAIAAHRPDVVHSCNGGVTSEIVTRAAHGTPTVVSFWGTDLLGNRLLSPVRQAYARVGVAASRRAAARADAIIVMSTELRDSLPSRVPRDRVVVIPAGVDLARFRPLDRTTAQAALGWDPARAHVLFPSDPRRPEKRYDLARAAVAATRSSRPVELHPLVGVEHEHVPTWLNAAHAVLLTSAHEGSPNAIKEALACDVPVVSTDVGDVRVLAGPVEGCHVSADGSVEDLAEGLTRALALGDGRVDGRAQVEPISLARVAARIVDVYERVVPAG